MADRWVLQFCHCHYGPFLDVARQYAVLFKGSPVKVLTVYLTGADSPETRQGSASDEVIFLGFKSKDIRGLKLKAISALRKIIASRNIELVIAHRFKPVFIACLASKVPVVGVHHAFGDYTRLPRRWFAQTFRKRLILLGVSDAVRDDIRKSLPDWPDARIETLHNRLDVTAASAERLPRAVARQQLGLPENSYVIGNVGRLHPDKDQATLLSAFAKARPFLPPGTLLAIAGSGPLLEHLLSQARDLGISEQVRFLGQIPDARRFFPAFDLFVLSSDHEPFGMVLLEAMAARVPVMASNCGGAPEVIGRPDMLFELRDSGQLADRLVAFARQTDIERLSHITDDQSQRLDHCFSDQAAKIRFFSLPAIATILRSRN